jgi:hypothetical protein
MRAEPPPMSASSPSLVLETPSEEGPYYVHNEVRVSGSAVGAERVTVELVPLDADGNALGTGVSFEERLPDSHAGSDGRFNLRLSTAECSSGTHSVNVRVTARDGTEVQAAPAMITVEPYDEAVEPSAAAIDDGVIVISSEIPGSGAVEELGRVFIRGWCYAAGGIDRVLAFLDGRSYHEVLFPVPRPDVQHALGRPDALLSGFALPLDAEACPPGEHSLTLVVVGTDRRRVGRTLSFTCGAASNGPLPPRSPDATVDPSTDHSDLLARYEFESLRATVAERHAFVSLTESNIVTAAYGALQRSNQQKLDTARRALDEAERRAAAAEYWLAEQHRSFSWRVTKPLRAAKQAARRIRH